MLQTNLLLRIYFLWTRSTSLLIILLHALQIVRYLELALEKRVVVGKDRGFYVETIMTFKTINYCWFIYYASATLWNYGYVLNTYRIEWMVYVYFT